MRSNSIKDINNLEIKPDFIAADLLEAAKLVLEEERQ